MKFLKLISLKNSNEVLFAGICGRNEKYSDCGPCEPSCDLRKPVCSQECRKGCFCKKGYIRSQDGSCITEDQCLPGTVKFIYTVSFT